MTLDDMPLIRTAPTGTRCATCGHPANLVLGDELVCLTLADIAGLHARKVRLRALPTDIGADGAR